MSKTKIEWADAVWNPVTGCSKVSEGCRNCYAERMAKRLAGRCGYPVDEPFRIMVHPERFEEPLRWRKPRRVFVCSMGDLFHSLVNHETVVNVFKIMAKCPQHTFMILTKRPGQAHYFMREFIPMVTSFENWPLPNIGLGVSVEDQPTADLRVPILLDTPAAWRFVSYEPALGPVYFRDIEMPDGDGLGSSIYSFGKGCGLDWVIAGGETGPGARPAHPDWFRSVRDQCQAASVPFFFKQWGEWVPYDSGTHYAIVEKWRDKNNLHDNISFVHPSGRYEGQGALCKDSDTMARVGRKAAGRLLDGRTWDEFLEAQP